MRKAGHDNEDIYVCVCNFGFCIYSINKAACCNCIIGGVLVVEIGLFLAKKLNTKRIFYAIENKLGLE